MHLQTLCILQTEGKKSVQEVCRCTLCSDYIVCPGLCPGQLYAPGYSPGSMYVPSLQMHTLCIQFMQTICTPSLQHTIVCTRSAYAHFMHTICADNLHTQQCNQKKCAQSLLMHTLCTHWANKMHKMCIPLSVFQFCFKQMAFWSDRNVIHINLNLFPL